MTPDNESISVQPRATASRSRVRSPRRPLRSALAGLAIVGFSAAMIAPTGMAIADPVSDEEDTVTVYSLAEQDTQDITVTIEGSSVSAVSRAGFEVYVKPKPKPVVASASSGSTQRAAAPPRYTGGGTKEQWMTAAGIAQSDWGYVDYIVSRESGWNPNATNASSGACGLVQALPCSKVPGGGYDPVANLRWATGYAVGRYGSWANAYGFWTRNHWW